MTIHGSEAHIGHLVQLAQGRHYHFADLLGGDFLLQAVIGHLLHRAHDALDVRGGDGALVAGLNDAVADLLRVKQLPRVVLFDHQQLGHFHLFIGGKAAAAVDAFAAAADAGALFRGPGIDNAAVGTVAELAFHIRVPSFAQIITDIL